MIVQKIYKDNQYSPDLTQIPDGYEVEGYKINPDGETYTVNLRWTKDCPEQVANWKLTIVLEEAGYIDQINAMMEQAKFRVRHAWENATNISRTSPALNAAAEQLGLTEEQVDQLFIEAEKISA